jgi:hypothetical protein
MNKNNNNLMYFFCRLFIFHFLLIDNNIKNLRLSSSVNTYQNIVTLPLKEPTDSEKTFQKRY